MRSSRIFVIDSGLTTGVSAVTAPSMQMLKTIGLPIFVRHRLVYGKLFLHRIDRPLDLNIACVSDQKPSGADIVRKCPFSLIRELRWLPGVAGCRGYHSLGTYRMFDTHFLCHQSPLGHRRKSAGLLFI